MSPNDPRHGSNAGYYVHRRAGEKPCLPCAAAHNAHVRMREADKRFGEATVTTDIPLAGGRWVPNPATGGLTKLWQKDPETIADPPAEPKRRYAKADEVICGTQAGYYRHKRKLNEPACEECRAANAAAERARYARRGGRRAA